MWKKCEPFSNPTVKRMLTVAHGTFCIVDISDASVRSFVTGGGSFKPIEFFLRFNIVGVGRFTISLYGEFKREIGIQKAERAIIFARKEKLVVENYIEGLKLLSELYEDKNLLNFITDFKNSDMYIQAFEKSVLLATKRNVPNQKILKNKSEIDSYFLGGKKVSKKKSNLQIAQEQAESTIEKTNDKIEELGKNTYNLYTALNDIQELFDKIRNVPSEKRLEYNQLKGVRLNWKHQVEKIESDYKNAVAKMLEKVW